MAGPLLLFDGTCTFCDALVRFVLRHERHQELRFAALQSAAGRRALASVVSERELEAIAPAGALGDPSTLVLIEDGIAYTHSTGALRLARHLCAPWRWLAIGRVIPRPVRDAAYRWFARHRHRWFGRLDACVVPSPEVRARFVE